MQQVTGIHDDGNYREPAPPGLRLKQSGARQFFRAQRVVDSRKAQALNGHMFQQQTQLLARLAGPDHRFRYRPGTDVLPVLRKEVQVRDPQPDQHHHQGYCNQRPNAAQLGAGTVCHATRC